MKGWKVLLCLLILPLISCRNPKLLVVLGNHLYSRGEYTGATIRYFQAMEKTKANPTIKYNLGNVYHALGETSASVDTLGEAVETGENAELRYRGHFNLGIILFETGNFEGAVLQYIAALRAKPEEIDAKINLEIALRKMQSGGKIQPTRGPPGSDTLEERYRKVLETVRREEEYIWQSQRQ